MLIIKYINYLKIFKNIKKKKNFFIISLLYIYIYILKK